MKVCTWCGVEETSDNTHSICDRRSAGERAQSHIWGEEREFHARRSDPAHIMDEMALTFRARNAIYGDNYKVVGAVMAALFPNGVELKTPLDFVRWHLFELKVVKLTRLANAGLAHIDSIHDDAVYGAMLEAVTPVNATPIGRKS